MRHASFFPMWTSKSYSDSNGFHYGVYPFTLNKFEHLSIFWNWEQPSSTYPVQILEPAVTSASDQRLATRLVSKPFHLQVN